MDRLEVSEVKIARWDRFPHSLGDKFALYGIELRLVAQIKAIAEDTEVRRIAVGFVAHSAASMPARWSARSVR